MCLPTEHLGVVKNSLKRVRAFQIEYEFVIVGFWGEEKTEAPGEKSSRSKGEYQQQTQPIYGVDAGIWTRATLMGASTYITAPLLPFPDLIVQIAPHPRPPFPASLLLFPVGWLHWWEASGLPSLRHSCSPWSD